MRVDQYRSFGRISGFKKYIAGQLRRSGVTFAIATAILLSAFPLKAYAEKNVWLADTKADSEAVPFKIDDLTGPAGEQVSLNVKISQKSAKPGNSLTFYGLPDKILLSSGIRKSKVWIVPVDKAQTLTLIAPSGFKGQFEAAAILRKKSGHVIEGQRFVIKIMHPAKFARKKKAEQQKIAQKAAQQKTTAIAKLPKQDKPKTTTKTDGSFALSVRPSEKVKPKQETQVKKEEKIIPVKKKKSAISPELEETLLSKAKQLLKDGNIVAARETLKFLAEQGNAESAHLIAKSFDPEEFKNFNATGIEPDLAEAKKWYTKAAELGAKDAQERLKEYANAKLK